MNDRVVLLGVIVLIANLFVLFSGSYSFNYYAFAGVLAVGVVIALAGAFAKPSKRQQQLQQNSSVS